MAPAHDAAVAHGQVGADAGDRLRETATHGICWGGMYAADRGGDLRGMPVDPVTGRRLRDLRRVAGTSLTVDNRQRALVPYSQRERMQQACYSWGAYPVLSGGLDDSLQLGRDR